MSTGAKIFVAFLAIVGGIIAINLALSLLHYLVIAAVVLAIGYVVVKVANPGRKGLTGSRKFLP